MRWALIISLVGCWSLCDSAMGDVVDIHDVASVASSAAGTGDCGLKDSIARRVCELFGSSGDPCSAASREAASCQTSSLKVHVSSAQFGSTTRVDGATGDNLGTDENTDQKTATLQSDIRHSSISEKEVTGDLGEIMGEIEGTITALSGQMKLPGKVDDAFGIALLEAIAKRVQQLGAKSTAAQLLAQSSMSLTGLQMPDQGPGGHMEAEKKVDAVKETAQTPAPKAPKAPECWGKAGAPKACTFDEFLKYAGGRMDAALNKSGDDDDDHPKCAELFEGKVGLAEWDCVCHGYTAGDKTQDAKGLIKGGLVPEFICAKTEGFGSKKQGHYKCLKSVLKRKKGSMETWLLGQSEAQYYAESLTSLSRMMVIGSRRDLLAVDKYFEDKKKNPMSGSIRATAGQVLRSLGRLSQGETLSTIATQFNQLASGQNQVIVNSPNAGCDTETKENKRRCGMDKAQRISLAKSLGLECIVPFVKPEIPCGTRLAKLGRKLADKPHLRLSLGDSLTARKKGKKQPAMFKAPKIKVPKIKAPSLKIPKLTKSKDDPEKDARECLNPCRPCYKYNTIADMTSLKGIGCKSKVEGGGGTINCKGNPELPTQGPKSIKMFTACGGGKNKRVYPTVDQDDLRQRLNDICTLPAFKNGQCRSTQLKDEYEICKYKGCWKCKLIQMGTVKGFACSRLHKSGNVMKSTYCKAYLIDSADQGFVDLRDKNFNAEGASMLPAYKTARLIETPILKETRCIDGPEGSACQETKINTCSRIRKWDQSKDPECVMSSSNKEIAKFF